jgi:hypothetical protein
MVTPSARISERAFNRVLSTRPDPLGILQTTARVVARAKHVTLNERRIETVAQVLSLRTVTVPPWNYQYHFFDDTERTLSYLFALDALNFSFWGAPRWSINYRGVKLDGYWALAAALKRAVEENANFLDSNYLAEISPGDLGSVLRGQGEIPLFVERWRSLQELGRVLRDRFAGSAARVVESAGRDAPRLAQLIADNFSSFCDTAIYDSSPVNFFKRAQILVADVAGSFDGKRWGEFKNLSELTAFADYKVPQILRGWQILNYGRGLARRVDDREELPKDSAEEIEIRATMLWGVELLREALARRGRQLTSVQMDWFLWERSQHNTNEMKPYHRVRTIYY